MKNPVGRKPLFPKFKYQRVYNLLPGKKIVVEQPEDTARFAHSVRNYAIRNRVKVSVKVIGDKVHVMKIM